MTFFSKIQKLIPAYKPLLPQLPLRAISSGVQRVNGSPQTQIGLKSATPVSLTNREGKQISSFLPSTTLRAYHETKQTGAAAPGSSLDKLVLFLAATPLLAVPATDDSLVKQADGICLTIQKELQEKYPGISIQEIRKMLSETFFEGSQPDAFAEHLVDFMDSIDRSNAAFPDRETLSIEQAFTAYKGCAEMIRSLPRGDDGKLYINEPNLTLLPPEIWFLRELRDFTLYYTRLTSLPAEIGNLQYLKQAHIYGNSFKTFPDCLTKLRNLEELHYTSNQTETLSENFGRLTKLTNLGLRDNKLSHLPYSIGQLSNLNFLDVSQNQLAELPESIGSLTQLISCDTYPLLLSHDENHALFQDEPVSSKL